MKIRLAGEEDRLNFLMDSDIVLLEIINMDNVGNAQITDATAQFTLMNWETLLELILTIMINWEMSLRLN